MKQIWPDYSYSPTTNVLTLTGLNIDRDQLLLVAAPERGRIMYNFADSAVTASAYTAGANTSLTLVASTAGLTTTASLVIYYDDQLQSTAITISNFPATQPVSIASVTIGNTVTIAGTVSMASQVYGESTNKYAIRSAVAFSDGGDLLDVTDTNPLPISGTISGTVTIGSALPAGTNRIGVVTIGAGTVTIGAGTSQIGSVTASNLTSVLASYGTIDSGIGVNIKSVGGQGFGQGQTWLPVAIAEGSLPPGTAQIGSVTASISGTVPVSISSVTIGNSVTIGSLPAIAGTVTAMAGTNFSDEIYQGILAYANDEGGDGSVPLQVNIGVLPAISGTVTIGSALPAGTNRIGVVTIGGGTVTIGAGTAQIGSVTASISNSITIASFATSVTARLINPAGTAVTYAEVGTAGSPSIDVLSVQGVTGGTSLLIGGTTGSFTTRFGSVTTANTAQISTAVTNLSRKYLFVQNVTTSSNVITVGIGFTPTTTQGIQLAAGALIDFESSFIPTGAVYILSSVTGSPFTILEA